MYAPPLSNTLGAYLKEAKPELFKRVELVKSEKELIRSIDGKQKSAFIEDVNNVRNAYEFQNCQVYSLVPKRCLQYHSITFLI